MNACVRSTASGDTNRRSLQLAQHFFKCLLDGWKTGLHLPPMKIGAVIGNGYFNSTHWAGTRA